MANAEVLMQTDLSFTSLGFEAAFRCGASGRWCSPRAVERRLVEFLNGVWPPGVGNVANVLQIAVATVALVW